MVYDCFQCITKGLACRQIREDLSYAQGRLVQFQLNPIKNGLFTFKTSTTVVQMSLSPLIVQKDIEKRANAGYQYFPLFLVFLGVLSLRKAVIN